MTRIPLAVAMLLLAMQAAGVQKEAILWFPLGAPQADVGGKICAEVYHEGERLEFQSRKLSFLLEPRWFRTAALPQSVEDVPPSDQGTSLSFRITTTTNGLFRFSLKVRSNDRDVWREIEHRHTNITPFLFTFFADGKAVRAPMPREYSYAGGVNLMTRLAAKGEPYESILTIDPNSILALAGGAGIKELSVVAAFGEFQHMLPFFDARHGHDFNEVRRPQFSENYKGPPIIIRSDIVRLRHSHGNWEVVQNR